jgi:hypothetical protein
LVSVLEFSVPGGVIVEEAGDIFVSFLLDVSGTGAVGEVSPEGIVFALEEEALVSGALAGAGVLIVLVVGLVEFVEDVSLIDLSLLRLHPVKAIGNAIKAARMTREDVFIRIAMHYLCHLVHISGC